MGYEPWSQPAPNHQKGISFSRINRATDPDFKPGWQKHHVLPKQLSSQKALGSFWKAMGNLGVLFDDFTVNGVLLPATEDIAAEENLPLHRGPHREYSEAVSERVGAIEASWADGRGCPETAGWEAAGRLRLLQKALHRRLSREGRFPLTLNRRDPIGHGIEFATLDAMAEQLWNDTAEEDPAKGIMVVRVGGTVT